MKSQSIASLAITIVLIGSLISATANSQVGPPKNFVALQPVTPGSGQPGHINVSGTMLATKVHVSGTSGTGIGVGQFISSSTDDGAIALLARTTPSTGFTTAIRGETSSSTGIGVLGIGTATTDFPIGVWGHVSASGGIGVRGRNQSATGVAYGGYFESTGNQGRGLFATATSSTGATYGIQATNGSSSGKAIDAFASSISGTTYGVWAHNVAPNGAAVYGVASNNIGVWGEALSATGYGVFATGNLGASGTKSFVIDHPLDPHNKYLKHFCTEGPLPQNVYNGTVTTDANGRALVDLPDYFESINIEPRIQLTVEDSSDDFVMVKSTSPVQNGQFAIRTSKPGVKVYWEVKAFRNDKYVQNRPPQTEVDKPARERGRYQNPEFWGQPETKGIAWDGVKRYRKLGRTEGLDSQTSRLR